MFFRMSINSCVFIRYGERASAPGIFVRSFAFAHISGGTSGSHIRVKLLMAE